MFAKDSPFWLCVFLVILVVALIGYWNSPAYENGMSAADVGQLIIICSMIFGWWKWIVGRTIGRKRRRAKPKP